MKIEENSSILKIPKDRVAVVIGKKGEIRKKIEKLTGTKIEIDSEGEVIVTRPLDAEDPLKAIKALDIVKAIARGINPEKAFNLLKPDIYLEIIDLTELVSDKSLIRVRSRIIGSEGKSRKYIARLTKTEIVIYGKTVSIIGELPNIETAKKSIIKIIEGAPHSAVFKYLEINKLKLN